MQHHTTVRYGGVTMALDYLAVAAVAKNDIVESLAQTNKHLTETIAVLSKEHENLLLIIDRIVQLPGMTAKHK